MIQIILCLLICVNIGFVLSQQCSFQGGCAGPCTRRCDGYERPVAV